MNRRPLVRCCQTLLLAAMVLTRSLAVAQPPRDDEDNPFRPGLIARYRAGKREVVRVDEQIAFTWNDLSPDPRLPAGPFQASFTGLVHVQSPGAYTLKLFAAGKVKLSLAGQVLLEAESAQPTWLEAKAIELPFGFHPLTIEYEREAEPARLAAFWQGPQFQLEPLAGRWLLHAVEETPLDDFARGAQLVRALRCAACHDLPGESSAIPAPALDKLAGNLSPKWLIDRLTSGEHATAGKMPHFGFSREQASGIAAALFEASSPVTAVEVPQPLKPEPAKSKRKDQPPPPPSPSVALGRTLFHSTGCLACHRVDEMGADGLFGGGDLTRIAAKRPADFFARWLVDGASVNRHHRMPHFTLDGNQLASLSLYLQSLGKPAQATASHPSNAALVREARCASCHVLPRSLAAEAPKRVITAQSLAVGANCLQEPDLAKRRPGYRLDDDSRQAIREYLNAMLDSPAKPSPPSGTQLLAENNCLACHARGAAQGLGAISPDVIAAEPDLRDVAAALVPPALFGIGDKLEDQALVEAIANPPVRRPWLRVRMPKFPLEKSELNTLVAHLIETDRIPPPDTPTPEATANHTALDAAGPRLVTADGFGCTSCHAIGKWEPQKVALNAQGTSLSELSGRIRRSWFDRWVRNPARIVPRMEMPAVQQGIRGVLDEQLDAQLSAVWHVLNRPGFTPPSPSALRVVRRGNRPDVTEPAAVLTDVIEAGGQAFTKPLVIGLSNRHNVLVDLSTNRLAAWWIGDAARQQTRGKTWYWEAGVPQLFRVERADSPEAHTDLRLFVGDKRIAPVPLVQHATEFDWLEHITDGVRFAQRLHFPQGDTKRTVCVTQEFIALVEQTDRHGFDRLVEIESPLPEARFELLTLAGQATIAPDGRAAVFDGPQGKLRVSLAGDASQRLIQTPAGIAVILTTTKGRAACRIVYRSIAVADQFLAPPPVERIVERQTLAVVPGFEAVRLPLSDRAMPTGLAWRPDGTLAISSLEGRVWLARDTDGDELEDDLRPFSDELAAPYGLQAHGAAIDVINKYGLLRLIDADLDGHAERMELVASGWGHTRDYHDWAVGLPRDRAGNYYVSLPCQQDERTPAAATLRGTVVKLVAREPTSDNPQPYAIEPIAAGLRFPQGLALSAEEQLFATDNQGNYTPFNELNHILPGTRYGFINKLERGIDPPFRPAAVEIPHPWTRSVNGICFLNTPATAREKLGRDLFGPFEGHLIGCEYDTRRLVRLSLQKIGDDYQGAVYPFSREPAVGEPTFEGPLSCQVAPDGDVYIGNIRDSGWGAGANTGSLVRLRPQDQLAPGIGEVRAVHDGFEIHFTQPVERELAQQGESYSLSSFRRIPTPAYGGEDVDRRVEKIAAIQLSDDARVATLRLGDLRPGFVYEFHLRNLTDGETFFPDEAYYTLRRVPE